MYANNESVAAIACYQESDIVRARRKRKAAQPDGSAEQKRCSLVPKTAFQASCLLADLCSGRSVGMAMPAVVSRRGGCTCGRAPGLSVIPGPRHSAPLQLILAHQLLWCNCKWSRARRRQRDDCRRITQDNGLDFQSYHMPFTQAHEKTQVLPSSNH